MINVGDLAPDMPMEIGEGNIVKLSQLRGKKVVLYFYPKDMTRGCTLEALDFNDHQADFDNLNTVVIGVSKDDLKSHGKFKEKNSLKFDLVSDPELELIKAYDVWKEKNMYGKKVMGVERTTFIIDEQGKIVKIYPKVKVDGHVLKVIEDLKSI